MPELPEVEHVRRGLEPWAVGSRIESLRVLDPRILGTTSKRTVDATAVDRLTASVPGGLVEGACRRGKFMWLPLATGSVFPDSAPEVPAGWAVALHLGMSGQVRIHTADDAVHRHTRAVFDMRSADGTQWQMRFVDQRIFGHIGLEPLVTGLGSPRLVAASAARIAPDPFEEGFDAAGLARTLKGRRTAIKAALLDQGVVSGIGNIYADEALFAAGVHPAARTDRLRISRIENTLHAAREVMARAIEAGGTSFDELYVNVNGESGYFDRSLGVYGKAGSPCARCGETVRSSTIAGRTSHWCPTCQKPQRRY